MKIILMRLRITIAMLEIRNRETLLSKVNICKSDVKIGDYADSLTCTKLWHRLRICTRVSQRSLSYPNPIDKAKQLCQQFDMRSDPLNLNAAIYL